MRKKETNKIKSSTSSSKYLRKKHQELKRAYTDGWVLQHGSMVKIQGTIVRLVGWLDVWWVLAKIIEHHGVP